MACSHLGAGGGGEIPPAVGVSHQMGHWYVPYNGERARDKGPTFLDPHSRGADRCCRTRGMSRGRGWHDRLWADAGITTTYDWGLARRTANRMLVMLKGEVVADGPIERVCFDREYGPGTLRQKIMGCGDRLPSRHPGARHRR